MKRIRAADRATITTLVRNYGPEAVVKEIESIKIVTQNKRRPADPEHNCASIWAFVEFILRHKLKKEIKKKRLQCALDVAEFVLAHGTRSVKPFTSSTLRNHYFEAKLRSKTEPAIADLMRKTYDSLVLQAKAAPKYALPIPLLPRGSINGWVWPEVDTDVVDPKSIRKVSV
jgi:hypothetical protein